MSKEDSQGDTEFDVLSGLWWGQYWYDDTRFSIPSTVAFTATLFEHGNDVSGRTLEPNTFVLSEESELSGILKGSRSDTVVKLVKNYDGIPSLINYDIWYTGELNASKNQIVGRWTIQTDLSNSYGGFELSRLSSKVSLSRSASIEL